MGGDERDRSVEIISQNPNVTCDPYPDAPYQFSEGATFTHAGYPVICGGFDNEHFKFLDECWRAEEDGWVQLASMSVKRQNLAGVDLNDKEFWITGIYSES